MNEKPILFTSEMVQAILDGRKTETRRTIKPQILPDDHLYVRETWRTCKCLDEFSPKKLPPAPPIQYKADMSIAYNCQDWGKWRPSIFMPRDFSRILLKVRSVEMEELQNITLDDVLAEGCPTEHCAAFDWFEQLWDSLNLKRGFSYKSNPWIWVVKFELVTNNS